MASGPWDNVQLPGPPNGPAYLSAASQLMGATGNAINSGFNAYQQGQNFQYQQAQRNFFQDPANQQLLQQALQTTDPAAASSARAQLMQGLIQAGGTSTAQQMMPQILQQPFRDLYLKRLQNNGGDNQPQQPTTPTATYGITGNNGTNTGNETQPRYSAGEGTNINTLIGKTGSNVPDQVAQRIATSVGADSPEDNLTSDQAARAAVRLNQYLKRNGGNVNPVPQSGNGEQEAAGNQLNPSTGPGSTAMSPQQTGMRTAQRVGTPPPPAVVSPAANFNERFAPTGVTSTGAESMVPPGADPGAFSRALRARADKLREDARIGKFADLDTSEDEKRAETLDKQAQAIDEQLGKGSTPTTEQKNLRTGTMQRSKEIEGEVTAGQKDLEAINKVGNSVRIANDKVQLAKSLMMSPNFYSGPAEGINRSFKQWTATLGGDPNKGTPQEAFNKTISDLLSEQIRAMAQSGVGRVLVTEVQTMKNSIAAMGITPSSNRLLIEEVDRVHKAQTDIQDLANDYAQRYGHLDPGFNKVIAQYYKQHPLFSERELRDPRLIAPPRMPTNITNDPVAIKKWANQNGLKAGDPFVVQDGSGPYKVPAL